MMFGLEKMDETTARNLNPQVLAFVGDGVYSLYIRQLLVMTSNLKGKDLHNEVTSYVKAGGQSNFINKLLPLLTERELSVFKRARNHKTLSQAKNQNIVDFSGVLCNNIIMKEKARFWDAIKIFSKKCKKILKTCNQPQKKLSILV